MRRLRALFGESIVETYAYCEKCRTIIPAESVEHDGAVWMRSICPEHGVREVIQSRNPAYFRMIETILPKMPDPALIEDAADARHVRGVFIDVTEQCNMMCPNCLTDANAPTTHDPPTIESVLKGLEGFLPRKPVLYLTGGEPTLRKDIFDWVRRFSAEGYDVKLLTNGLKLRDFNYCKELKEAGVTWVLLQFDTFYENALKALRGRSGLAAIREQVIENLANLNMEMDLACMIDRNHNIGHMGDLIRYGFRTPGVRHVSFMPSRRLGRGDLTTDENLLQELEMMEAIEEQTGGAIRKRDWIAFLAAMATVYKTTSNANFAPRRCFLPLPLLGTAKKFRPATRIANLLQPGNMMALAAMASEGGRIESAKWTERSLLTSIETFREPNSIDVGDASRCSRYYFVDGTVRQACLYNVIVRPEQRDTFQDHGGAVSSDFYTPLRRTGRKSFSNLRTFLRSMAS